jgi:AraC family transcriptional regulator
MAAGKGDWVRRAARIDHRVGGRNTVRYEQMMGDTERSLSDVALARGFADQSHFTSVVTRMTGFSPGVWRRQHI